MSFQRLTLPDGTAPGETEPREIKVTNIGVLADKPQLTATALKAAFDAAGVDIKTFLTGLVNDINETLSAIEVPTAAANIGAVKVIDDEESSENIQSQLARLKKYFDEKALEVGAGDMLESTYVNPEGNGKVLASINADKLGGIAALGFSKEITGQTAKSTLADSDAFAIADSESSGLQKKTLWGTIKSTMQTAFMNTFAAKAHRHPFVDLDGAASYDHAHSGIYALSSHSHPYSQLSGVAAASHSHGVTELSGVAKSAGGIRIFIGGESQAGAANGDLWFNT